MTPAPAGGPSGLVLGLLAGEPSGDVLGAGLMAALRARCPDVRFVGVGGPQMTAQGLQSLVPLQRMSVHGFVDPLLRLPSLLRVFLTVRRAVRAAGAHAFIGIDFNVFNLLLERSLRKAGTRTVHYVSPSVYAWRRGRVHRVARATDLLLTLFPFEPPLYAAAGARAVFVGHPLADELRPGDADAARAALDVTGSPVVALLPGSRGSEVRLMGATFVQAATCLLATHPHARFVVPCVNPVVRALMQACVAGSAIAGRVTLLDGQSRLAMTAADAVLVKSGTGTLEALLLERPMVVAYRLGAVTAAIVRRLLRTPFVALPNILAGRRVVPELLQEDATPDALAAALAGVLAAPAASRDLLRDIAGSLRRDASARAADAVLALLAAQPGAGAAQGDAR
jgi:lipid-A-disaccharide synthase